MSWNQLFDLLKKGDLKKIREFRPYLVIKDEVNSAYDKMHEFIEKIDVLNIHTHYYLSDYSISYLGYSNTKNKDDKLRAEYVLTGSENSKVSKAIVDAEIYAMRLCFNFIECFSNELVRSKIRKFSFGSIKLFVLEAIALSLYEAKKDLDKIRDGGRVPFIKSSQGFMSANGVKSYEKGYYYHDYLKLLMMLLPKDVIAKRIIRAVENQSEMKLKDLAATIEIEREVEFEGRVIPWKVKKKIRGELSFIK